MRSTVQEFKGLIFPKGYNIAFVYANYTSGPWDRYMICFDYCHGESCTEPLKQFHLANIHIPCECAKDKHEEISDALHEEEHRRMYVELIDIMENHVPVP